MPVFLVFDFFLKPRCSIQVNMRPLQRLFISINVRVRPCCYIMALHTGTYPRQDPRACFYCSHVRIHVQTCGTWTPVCEERHPYKVWQTSGAANETTHYLHWWIRTTLLLRDLQVLHLATCLKHLRLQVFSTHRHGPSSDSPVVSFCRAKGETDGRQIENWAILRSCSCDLLHLPASVLNREEVRYWARATEGQILGMVPWECGTGRLGCIIRLLGLKEGHPWKILCRGGKVEMTYICPFRLCQSAVSGRDPGAGQQHWSWREAEEHACWRNLVLRKPQSSQEAG